ncbi:beta-galactosidase [Sphingomonas sp. So64.6b]|uniref:beta-galactosidase n=1 Tax=Sphingomonas sp. So64.6b TaxID=2997354 RepID=UPI0016029575|nr:beta-galactosidase [Sphingomonas sp. So64.6b]QNA85392.1 beta-galactosidase [Sphingomonas sp. So64.6b]
MRLKVFLSALLLAAAPAVAATGEPAPFKAAGLSIGSSWYPEQWPEARWEVDLALMERAQLNVVRIGEFAWARMEPADGQFDFAWLDRAIAAAARHKIRVVLGTPTAGPPIWLTEAHPDVLRVNEDGSVEGHGERRQFSFASATYRGYARRIAAEMARRYGRNPNVVGWQIDNEIGVPSFDGEVRTLWASWLAKRYGSIDALNRRWTTEYWSQRYQRFDQIPLKSKGPQNPALILDYHRFVSSVWADYVGEQAVAIRAHADPRQFVTTNSTAWNNNFDQYLVHRDLDIAAWDDYVPGGRPDWVANALHHDLVRGYKRRNFWVMEAQPGRVDWAPVNRSLDPGQVRELAWQMVAHGGDAILYWQWRSALNGQEQYHGTVVGPDGMPMPIYDEIAKTAAEFASAAPLLAGTSPYARIAMLYSQESRWAVDQEKHSRDYDPVATMQDWYRPVAASGRTIDILPGNADLAGYALVVAPLLNIVDNATAERLTSYVRGGGHLVLGPRSGMKDDDNALWTQRQPGPLAALLGARVENYYPIDAGVIVAGASITGSAKTWAEVLKPTANDVEILATYSDGPWLAGKPAIVSRRVGKGRITYVGAIFDSAGQRAITDFMLASVRAGAPPLPPADGVEAVERKGPGGRYLIVINHAGEPAQLQLPAGARRVVGDLDAGTLPAHGVALLSLPVH